MDFDDTNEEAAFRAEVKAFLSTNAELARPGGCHRRLGWGRAAVRPISGFQRCHFGYAAALYQCGGSLPQVW